jgi:hypothetical protein
MSKFYVLNGLFHSSLLPDSLEKAVSLLFTKPSFSWQGVAITQSEFLTILRGISFNRIEYPQHIRNLVVGNNTSSNFYVERPIDYLKIYFSTDWLSKYDIYRDFVSAEIYLPTSYMRSAPQGSFKNSLLFDFLSICTPYYCFSNSNVSWDMFTVKHPWQYYAAAMVFGPELINKLNILELDFSHIWCSMFLGDSVWISDQYGLGNEVVPPDPRLSLMTKQELKQHLWNLQNNPNTHYKSLMRQLDLVHRF